MLSASTVLSILHGPTSQRFFGKGTSARRTVAGSEIIARELQTPSKKDTGRILCWDRC